MSETRDQRAKRHVQTTLNVGVKFPSCRDGYHLLDVGHYQREGMPLSTSAICDWCGARFIVTVNVERPTE
jgi:hypothetical protein